MSFHTTHDHMPRPPRPGDICIQTSCKRNMIPEMLKQCIMLAQINYTGENLKFFGYTYDVINDGEGGSNYNLYAYFEPPVPRAHLDPSNLTGEDVPLWTGALPEDEVAKLAGRKERQF